MVSDTKYLCRYINDEATANLIAAAPEMYEALQLCEQKLDAIDPYCELLANVRKALSKAAGEEEM